MHIYIYTAQAANTEESGGKFRKMKKNVRICISIR
jgi:hypothetical protein